MKRSMQQRRGRRWAGYLPEGPSRVSLRQTPTRHLANLSLTATKSFSSASKPCNGKAFIAICRKRSIQTAMKGANFGATTALKIIWSVQMSAMTNFNRRWNFSSTNCHRNA